MSLSLLPLLKAMPDAPEALRRAFTTVDAAQLAPQALAHGLSGVLLHELRRADLPLPQALQRALRRDSMAIAATGMRVKALLLRALDALAAHGLRPVVLKGFPLGLRLYPDPLFRPTTDVDLLVLPEQLPAAEAALSTLGLSRARAPLEAYWRAHHHHVTFHGKGALVELHFRAHSGFGGAIEGQALLARATADSLEGRALLTLRPEDELVYLATHAAGSLMLRLSWLYDLKLLVRRFPALDWAEVARVARASRMQGPVHFSLAAAARSLGAEVPSSALALLRPSRWQALLGQLAFRDELLEASAYSERPWVGLALRSLMSSTPRMMTRHAGHHLWRGTRRKLAARLPGVTPASWRG